MTQHREEKKPDRNIAEKVFASLITTALGLILLGLISVKEQMSRADERQIGYAELNNEKLRAMSEDILELKRKAERTAVDGQTADAILKLVASNAASDQKLAEQLIELQKMTAIMDQRLRTLEARRGNN